MSFECKAGFLTCWDCAHSVCSNHQQICLNNRFSNRCRCTQCSRWDVCMCANKYPQPILSIHSELHACCGSNPGRSTGRPPAAHTGSPSLGSCSYISQSGNRLLSKVLWYNLRPPAGTSMTVTKWCIKNTTNCRMRFSRPKVDCCAAFVTSIYRRYPLCGVFSAEIYWLLGVFSSIMWFIT